MAFIVYSFVYATSKLVLLVHDSVLINRQDECNAYMILTSLNGFIEVVSNYAIDIHVL